MHDSDIDLLVGGELQMEIFINGETNRYMSVIIGFLKGQSIIVRAPSVRGHSLFLREGLQVKGRLLSGNKVYGFGTSIKATSSKPYPHLHLDYPREFESLQVREVERVDISIPATISHVNQMKLDSPRKVDLGDISAQGTLIRTTSEFFSVADELTINCHVEYGEETTELLIPATVRNVRQVQQEDANDEVFLYGVQFNLQSHKDMLVVHGFVYETILQART